MQAVRNGTPRVAEGSGGIGGSFCAARNTWCRPGASTGLSRSPNSKFRHGPAVLRPARRPAADWRRDHRGQVFQRTARPSPPNRHMTQLERVAVFGMICPAAAFSTSGCRWMTTVFLGKEKVVLVEPDEDNPDDTQIEVLSREEYEKREADKEAERKEERQGFHSEARPVRGSPGESEILVVPRNPQED